MPLEPGFPKTLRHPSYRKGTTEVIGAAFDPYTGQRLPENRRDHQGTPDYLPPVTVNNSEQEAEYRAKGYLGDGEMVKQAAVHDEYPKMLTHPDHSDGVPSEMRAWRDEGGQVHTETIPGIPAKFPHVTVKNSEEELTYRARGYKPGGFQDPEAFATAKASPQVNGGYKPVPYPMAVHDTVVNDEAEHRKRFPQDFDAVTVTTEDDVTIRHEAPQAVLDELAALRARVAAMDAERAERPKRRGGRPRKKAAEAEARA